MKIYLRGSNKPRVWRYVRLEKKYNINQVQKATIFIQR